MPRDTQLCLAPSKHRLTPVQESSWCPHPTGPPPMVADPGRGATSNWTQVAAEAVCPKCLLHDALKHLFSLQKELRTAAYINILTQTESQDWLARKMENQKGRRTGEICLLVFLSDHRKPFSPCYLSSTFNIRIFSLRQSISKSMQDIVLVLHTSQFLSLKHGVVRHFIYSQILVLFCFVSVWFVFCFSLRFHKQ